MDMTCHEVSANTIEYQLHLEINTLFDVNITILTFAALNMLGYDFMNSLRIMNIKMMSKVISKRVVLEINFRTYMPNYCN